jgi:hypothetical protein
MLVYYLVHSINLKMEVIRSSETSVNIHVSTRRYIGEDRILRSKYCLHSRTAVLLYK